jgi:hypothetical protein
MTAGAMCARLVTVGAASDNAESMPGRAMEASEVTTGTDKLVELAQLGVTSG